MFARIIVQREVKRLISRFFFAQKQINTGKEEIENGFLHEITKKQEGVYCIHGSHLHNISEYHGPAILPFLLQ